MPIKLKNNAVGYLASAITASDVGLVLQSGNGASFPTLLSGDYFYVTLTSSGGTTEIVKVTARVGDTMTIVRAQESTTANSFAIGTRVELRVTASSVNDFVNQNAELGVYTPSSANAVTRTIQNKLRDIVSVKDFGAIGDSIVNDYAAIQSALNSGAKSIYFPSGNYRCDSTLTIPRNVSIFGDGPGQSIINFSQTTSLTDLECIRTAEGVYTQLPGLSAPISVGGTTMTFSSAPSVAVGDVLVIFNPTDYSWSGWRSYYRAGEYARVAKVSGSTITIEGGFADSYVAANVTVYKLTNFTSCVFSNFSVIGSVYDPTVDGLTIRNGIDCTIQNVRVTNCSYSGIQIDRCYNVSIINCSAKDDSEIVLAGDYGLLLGSSQVVQVQGGEFVAARHGVTIGGGSAVGDVPNRYLNISNAYIATVGQAIQAGDMHGNAEFVTYSNCYIDGSIVVAGDNQSIDNCVITNSVSNGITTMYFAELKGCNFRITNNTFINNSSTQDSSRGFFIECGGNGDVFSGATRGGTFFIDGNVMRASKPIEVGQAIYFHEVGSAYPGSEIRNIVVTNNKITRPDYTNTNRTQLRFAVNVRVSPGLTRFGDVTVANNDFYGGLRIGSDGANDVSARIVRVENNKFFEGYDVDINKAQYIYLTNNRFQNIRYYVSASGSSTTKPQYVNVLGNDTINCSWEDTGSSTTNADIVSNNNLVVVLNGNNTAGNFQILRLVSGAAGFTVGETITGATSGKTAIVHAKSGTTFISIRDTASGTFTGSETITGSTSAHTATLEATDYQKKGYYYHLSFASNGTVYVDHNISHWGLGNYSSGNSSVITTI